MHPVRNKQSEFTYNVASQASTKFITTWQHKLVDASFLLPSYLLFCINLEPIPVQQIAQATQDAAFFAALPELGAVLDDAARQAADG